MYRRIAVVDDDPAVAADIAAYVAEWAEMRGDVVNPDIYPSAEAFLFGCADKDKKDYEILLLDIELGVGREDGVSLAKRLRAENDQVQIVFVTGYSDYIAEGYEVSALHYLIKPIDKDKLFGVLDRAAAKMERAGRMLYVETADGSALVPLCEIKYLEVRHNYVTIRAGRDFTVKKTLGELERELDSTFFRVGRSYIVNLACVRKMTKTEAELSDNSKIPLPRGGYEALCKAIIKQL